MTNSQGKIAWNRLLPVHLGKQQATRKPVLHNVPEAKEKTMVMTILKARVAPDRVGDLCVITEKRAI